MLEWDAKRIEASLMELAERLFGSDRAQEIRPEIEVMADQLALLRNSPVDLLDEP
jgi:hypothetical protein